MTHENLLALHEDVSHHCRIIMAKKNRDYTGGSEASDPFANFVSSRSIGIHPVKGILLRCQDKIQRLNTFCNDGKLSVDNESAEDACKDLLNYAVLMLAIIEDEGMCCQGGVPAPSNPQPKEDYYEIACSL
jgi:hypothetical protein